MDDGNCELYDRFGNCTPNWIAAIYEWAWLILVLLLVAVELARWRSNRQHPRPLLLPPVCGNNLGAQDAPLASSYVAARTRALPSGPLSWLLRRTFAAISGTEYPIHESRRHFLKGSAVVEVYEIATDRVLASYRWTRNIPGAQAHAASLNERASQQGLSQFLHDLHIPQHASLAETVSQL